MRLRIDPWPSEYEAPIQFDGTAAVPPKVEVDPGVECAEWRAVRGEEAGAPFACCFVDGVRRVEARVLAGYAHGLFGSLGAGFVRCADGKATFGEIRIARHLILASEQVERWDIGLGTGRLCFDPLSVKENSPDAVLGELQSRMRTAETQLAEALAGESCVFVDGPSYRGTGHQRVVGVVKRIFEPYLREPYFELVERLRMGERTPLFAIMDPTYSRYSCFLRLAEPRPVEHALAGIVRIEMGYAAGLGAAKELANLAASRLPRFAPCAAREARAPQNLLPVGALEQEMRRRLGDPILIRRAIERVMHEQRDR